jgi:tRNA(Arg) A34 adenosine deaminase TadA
LGPLTIKQKWLGFYKSYHEAFVMTSDGEILTKASNWNSRSGKSQWGHAERVAWHKFQKLPKSRKKLKKHKSLFIFVIRIMKDGTLGMSKPCPKCMASFAPGVKKVIFSTGDPEKPFDYINL